MCYKICLLILAVVGLVELLPMENHESRVKYNTSSKCESPFQTVNNGCYFFSNIKLNMEAASLYCEDLTPGHNYEITLAMLDYDRDEDQAFLDAVDAKKETYWIGGKTEDGTTWFWVDGRNIYRYASFWGDFEPDEANNKCMAAGYTQLQEDYDLYVRSYVSDHDCSDSLNFVCQTGNIICPAYFIRVGNYCYLQSWTTHAPALSWKDAREYCHSLSVPVGYHADLAVLGLEDQNDYRLMNVLLENATLITWIGAYHNKTFANECSYYWIDGRELPIKSIYWGDVLPLGCDDDGKNSVGLYNPFYFDYNTGSFLFDYYDDDSWPFICQMFKDT